MAIRGSLREASLPDVLQLLAMGRKTGCLSVAHRQAFGNIYFDKGRISFASVVNRRDRLGDILVKDGLIVRSDLDDAIALQAADPNRRLGELLVECGAIAREELHKYIRRQIEEAVYFLFTWNQGTFTFEADERPEHQDFLVSINPESLLLEGARRVDEWSLIEKKVPGFDCIFAIDQFRLTESGLSLTTEQATLAPLIDGQRDVTALIDESGLAEFSVGKALYGLASAGFIHRVGRSRGAENVAAEAKAAEHRNLGVAFYRSSMFDEAVREFRRVMELLPGDFGAEFHLGLIDLRLGRLDDAVRTFRVMASRPAAGMAVHANLAYALERSGRLEEARTALLEAARLAPEDPVVRLTEGVLALRRGDVKAADAALQACAERWATRTPPAAFYHYAGLVAALAGDTGRAVAALTEGIATHPHAAVLYNNLAAVEERRGRFAEAVAAVDSGLLEEPTLPQLHKNIGDLHYRAGRYDDALDAFQRAVRHEPELGGDVYLKMGNIRYRRREKSDAVRCWERSLSLAPENPMARNNLETARRLS